MIICYARCRFRSGDSCGLVLGGGTIQISGKGECQTRQDLLPQQTKAATQICEYWGCNKPWQSQCTVCRTHTCESHRLVHPTSGLPLCTDCWISYGPAEFSYKERYDEPA